MRDLLLPLRRNPERTLQAELRERLVSAILEGQIPPERPLPSCRSLARRLGVARNTVALAYQALVEEGFLVSRPRSGFYVRTDIRRGRLGAVPLRTEGEAAAFAREPDWQRRLIVRPSHQRNIERPRDWSRYPYPFVYGQIDHALFPLAAWRECSRQALGRAAVESWVDDVILEDDPLLVEQIRCRLLPRRGIFVDRDQILVTLGAQQALYLLARLLIHEGSVVAIEDPGYPDLRNILALRTRQVRPIPVDAAGLPVDDRLSGCDYVFVTPSHQYPTTVTMPLDRRRALLQWAERADFVIVEDDYECETNYVSEPTPALKSLDTGGRVLYVASLSKTLCPGLRLGCLVGPRELIAEARALRRLMLRHPPGNNQRTAALFLAQGHHDGFIHRLHRVYRERWQRMGEALARHLPNSFHTPTFGGTSYWVRGPEGLDADRLAVEARRHGLLIEAGSVCFAGPKPPRNFLRLGFSAIAAERIEPGIRLLAELVRRQLA